MLAEVFVCQDLWYKVSAIAIDMHLADVSKTSTTHNIICQLMKTRIPHTYLCPLSF